MDSKDLFDAINIAAEDYVSDLPDNTEGLRPVVLHADKKPRSVKRIVLGAAACAAAVAVIGVSVTVGMKNYSQRGSLVSDSSKSVASNIERNFAPAAEILRIRDVGFYTEDMYSYFLGYNKYREEIEKWYSQPMSKEALDNPIPVSSYLPPQPDVYYFNDIALDERMLSNEAYGFLSRYCLLSEEDRAGETVPDDVKYLTGGGFVRFENVGYLRDKYTVEQLEECEKSCVSYRAYSFLSSRFPPEPDVYYYNDIPYHLDQILSEDTKNWLKWFCWLKEEDQAQLGGYVPGELSNIFTIKCYPEPKFVNYKGKAIDIKSVSNDTEVFLEWYETLSEELKEKVDYAPEELFGENLDKFPAAEPDVEIIGADGVPLTIKELYSNQTSIYKMENIGQGESKLTELSINELEQWDEILCYGFVYLAEPGSNDFKRYTVGDEIMGLKITRAATTFRRFEGVSDPALYYAGGEVTFEGTAKVDILAFMNDDFMKCEISGLPIIDVDEKARAEGKIVPKQHSADKFADDPAALFNDDSHCYGGGIVEYGVMEELQGQIQRDVEIEYINMDWRYDFDNTKWYQVMAHLSKND